MRDDERRPEGALPRSGADRARALAIPALLAAIALFGVFRSITLDQSSWQGASFGMFATYDNRSSRTVRVTVQDGTDRHLASLPAELHDDATRLLVVPTDGAARDLAEEALRLIDPRAAATVVVEVRRVRVRDDDAGLSLRVEPMARGTAGP